MRDRSPAGLLSNTNERISCAQVTARTRAALRGVAFVRYLFENGPTDRVGVESYDLRCCVGELGYGGIALRRAWAARERHCQKRHGVHTGTSGFGRFVMANATPCYGSTAMRRGRLVDLFSNSAQQSGRPTKEWVHTLGFRVCSFS